jgi:hypothetical protein
MVGEIDLGKMDNLFSFRHEAVRARERASKYRLFKVEFLLPLDEAEDLGLLRSIGQRSISMVSYRVG